MHKKYSLLTSECVSPGHPDKIADQISDTILDHCLTHDSNLRLACETLCTRGQVIVAGEIKTNYALPVQIVQDLVREKIYDLGYRPGMGFDENCGLLNALQMQSKDIGLGLDKGGAGDQGLMFGGAVRETQELMPLVFVLARDMIILVNQLRNSGELAWSGPDAKVQITLAYDEKGSIDHVQTVIFSIQHSPDIAEEVLQKDLIEKVIYPVLLQHGLNPDRITSLYFNPTGRFVIGGPQGDTGLTGRKLMVDTYGGYFRHGGGAFSGKDSSKVDRTAAYAARWIAKNLVASELVQKCEVQLAYAIGLNQPISVYVETFQTGMISDIRLSDLVNKVFDLSVQGLEKTLKLRNPPFRYQDLAAFGHMGRKDIILPWEELNKVEEILFVAKKESN